jgi:protein TonB
MRAQLASDYAEDRAGGPWESAPILHSVAVNSDSDYERGVYVGGRGMNPVAAAASILVAFGAFASFLYIGGGHHHHHHEQRLTVMELADLQPPPPPPPPAPNKIKPQQDRPPEIVAPPAIVQTPAPPVQVATAPQPAPVAAITGTSKVQTPVAPPAPPSTQTANVGDLSARMISATPPSYPLEARRSHEQGIVVLTVMLGTDGRVANVSISHSSGSSRLDHAALSAVKRWRWAPMIRNGNPVLVQGLVTIPFVLQT